MRGTVKRLIHKCIKCFRFKPQDSRQIMEDLPIDRVCPSRLMRLIFAGSFIYAMREQEEQSVYCCVYLYSS